MSTYFKYREAMTGYGADPADPVDVDIDRIGIAAGEGKITTAESEALAKLQAEYNAKLATVYTPESGKLWPWILGIGAVGLVIYFLSKRKAGKPRHRRSKRRR